MIEHPDPSTPTPVVVVGLGYVGLPLAVEASRAGFRVTGFDVSRRVTDGLMSGRSHVDDISDADVAGIVSSGFVATDDPSCFSDAAIIVICVPTPLDEHQAPDLTAVMSATDSISERLRPGTLVVLESTTYPGTTDGPVRETLERSGLRAGVDFSLAFSPERIDPGNPRFTLSNTPKVVGGLTPACTEAAVAFYDAIVEQVVPVSGPREAEMAKLLENTYRHVNIALVNEMAIFCQELGVDIWETIRAASTKPFGFQPFYPGAGVGGHCIPIDPNYLSHQVRKLGYQFRFVELAQEISNRMPAYVVKRVQDALNERGKPVKAASVLVLGLSYKADIADDRETPARPVIRGLRRLGAVITANDPRVSDFEVDGEETALTRDLTDLSRYDAVILLQPHAEYDLDALAGSSTLFFDCTGKARAPGVVRL